MIAISDVWHWWRHLVAWIGVVRVFVGEECSGCSDLLKHSYVDEINGKYTLASALSRRSHAMLVGSLLN